MNVRSSLVAGNLIPTITAKINVFDANDNAPMIVAPQGNVLLDENRPKGSWVVKVRAQDYDVGKNGDVSYSLVNSEKVKFSINHFTAEISTKRVNDFESDQRTLKLIARASDWGEPFRRQTEKVITIELQDFNDNYIPQFEPVD